MGFLRKLLGDDDLPEPGPAGIPEHAGEVPPAERVAHKGFDIIPQPKQLHDGQWVVEVRVEDQRGEAEHRRYDFSGPLTSFASPEEASKAGVDFAIGWIERLGAGPSGPDPARA